MLFIASGILKKKYCDSVYNIVLKIAVCFMIWGLVYRPTTPTFCWNETPVFHKILVPSPVLDFQSKTLGLFIQRPIHDPKAACSSGKGITLPETNVAPENRPLEKEMPYWKPPFLGANC